MRSRRIIAAVAFIIGLVVVWNVALAISYRQQGFDPDHDPLAADCDDCDLTAVLDALPVIGASLVVYIVMAGMVWWYLRRRKM